MSQSYPPNGAAPTASAVRLRWRSPAAITAMVILAVVVVALVMGLIGVLHRGPSSDPKDGSGLSLHDQVLQFTVPSAEGSAEAAFQSSLRDAALNQVDDLASNGVDRSQYTDPIAGAWRGDTGYIVFSNGQFSWYESPNGPSMAGPYRQGAYLWLPGCQLGGGFSMEWHGKTCYLIMLRYETVTQGQSDHVTRYGAFWVARADDGSLYVMNQRTSDEYELASA